MSSGARCITCRGRSPIAFSASRGGSAMGSAAFLVSACRYLARATSAHSFATVTPPIGYWRNRSPTFRRSSHSDAVWRGLESHCGPVARLSLWLATLWRKPLTFSIIIFCAATASSGVPRRHRTTAARVRSRRTPNRAGTPLFSDAELEPSLALVVAERRWLTNTHDNRRRRP